jgi:hypothetical protein
MMQTDAAGETPPKTPDLAELIERVCKRSPPNPLSRVNARRLLFL